MLKTSMVPKQLRRDALHMLILAFVFLVFFGGAKHTSAWAQMNPFADDPYDAIGSFAIQLAVLLALLSCIRAYRARKYVANAAEQGVIARGNLLCAGGILLTFMADGIAMARHWSKWFESSAGQSLCFVLVMLSIWAGISLWLAWRTAAGLGLLKQHLPWWGLALTMTVTVAVIALYPEEWRQSMTGALLTVVAGMALLFVPLRALASVISVDERHIKADALDDLSALFWRTERKVLTRLMGLIRRYWWTFTVLAGIAAGAFLASRELADGPPPSGRMLMVAAVYIGLESAAVLLEALLLSRPLRLFRRPRPILHTR